MQRVASALSDNSEHFYAFRDILMDMRFMPGGRIQSAIGSTKNVTAMSCYVLPIEDSFVDGTNSIMDAATKSAATMRMGGGCGYNFSNLRPRGDMIQKLQSSSSGPVSFMDIFDAVCRCTSSSGHRRGAQMGILDCSHPDIFEFIRAKRNETKLTGFNTSVAVTDEFMQAVVNDGGFALRFGGKTHNTVRARELWAETMQSTWDWAEPGVIFIDRINAMNNLWYCEDIRACNPCSEQSLPPFGCCLLGSFNLAKYVYKDGNEFFFDSNRLVRDIPHIVRAMDNVTDKTIYPLSEQRDEAISKRRMGLGITGLANAAEAMGKPYGSAEFVEWESQVLKVIANECYRASARLAQEKGAFPLFDRDKYMQSAFIRTLDVDTQAYISQLGIRNSHLTSIAPTGTISFCADNVSSGIEPVFDYVFDRTVIEFEGPRKETIEDYGVRNFGVYGKRASEVTIDEHLAVLSTAQRYVDSAVSKTCNIPSSMSFDDFQHVYTRAWELGCKGCATFRVGGKRRGMLESSGDAAQCQIDLITGKRDCG